MPGPSGIFTERVTAVAETKIKNSESKKIRRRLKEQHPLLSNVQLDTIWPASVSCTARKLPNRITVYFVGRNPLFYTADSPELQPTLYLLHAAPQLLPRVTIHDGVGDKLVGGAELFMPGVVVAEAPAGRSWVEATFGRFEKGDAWQVGEASQWAAVAVATWRVSSSELEMQGTQGRALDIVHRIGDELWRSGSQAVPNAPPESAADAVAKHDHLAAEARRAEEEAAVAAKRKAEAAAAAAFLEDAPKQIKRKGKALRQALALKERVDTGEVTPDADQEARIGRIEPLQAEIAAIEARVDALQNPPPASADAAVVPAATGEGEGGAAAEGAGGESGTAAAEPGAAEGRAAGDAVEQGAGEPAAEGSVAGESSEALGAAAAAADCGTGAGANAGSDDDGDGGESAMSMDDQLMTSVLLAVKDTLDPKRDLPILVSTFFAKHVLPASRRVCPGRDLNVKQTRHKKMGAFLDEMAAAGLLKLATEKAGVQRVTAVDARHPLLDDVDSADYPEPDDAAGPGAGGDADAALPQWAGKLPKKGSKKIEIAQQKKKGTKNVSVVSNLENFGVELDERIKRAIARHFSAAVSFGTGPDATKGKLVFVQGKYALQLAAWLTSNLGIPAQHIAVSDKGVSKRDKAINV